jgi:hypothetical protein
MRGGIAESPTERADAAGEPRGDAILPLERAVDHQEGLGGERAPLAAE